MGRVPAKVTSKTCLLSGLRELVCHVLVAIGVDCDSSLQHVWLHRVLADRTCFRPCGRGRRCSHLPSAHTSYQENHHGCIMRQKSELQWIREHMGYGRVKVQYICSGSFLKCLSLWVHAVLSKTKVKYDQVSELSENQSNHISN